MQALKTVRSGMLVRRLEGPDVALLLQHSDFFAFNIAGGYLPLILQDRNIAQGKTLADTYRSYVAIYAPGIGACLLAALCIELPRVGRKWSMVFFSALMGASMFAYTSVSTEAGSVGLNALEYIVQSAFNAILYAFIPETYPSRARGTASGVASTLGRISGIVAPLIAGPLYSAGGENRDKAQSAANVVSSSSRGEACAEAAY